MKNENDSIVNAIKKLGRSVTAADVSAETGLPLIVVNRLLNKVAADCQGTLQVGADGSLVYKFAAGFDTCYLKRGVAQALERAWHVCFRVGYYILRVSFGITLIASLITVVALIATAVLSMMQNASGNNGSNSGGGGINVDWLADIGRFFEWQAMPMAAGGSGVVRLAESDYKAYTEGRFLRQGESECVEDQGFLLNCYSYLFGDGNPNAEFEQNKWRIIADHIRTNNGVTTAEQLACLTGGNSQREYDALPVLVRFDGVPEVTESGNIIYLFPSLQQTGVSSATPAPTPQYLVEQDWPFSRQPFSSFTTVIAFAFANFGGTMWLLSHVSCIAALHPYRTLIDWLAAYAAFFIFFPLVRYLVLVFINAATTVRNKRRQSNYEYMRAHALAKLAEAQQYAITMKQLAEQHVIYSTDKDMLEQEF